MASPKPVTFDWVPDVLGIKELRLLPMEASVVPTRKRHTNDRGVRRVSKGMFFVAR